MTLTEFYIDYLKWKFGYLKIIASETHLLEIQFSDSGVSKVNPNDITIQTKRQLSEFFSKSLTEFSIPLNPIGTDFQCQVWDLLLKSSYGRTLSYSSLALSAGDIKKVRAVANANGKNPIPIIIPCHRVIGKDGSLVGYAGGLAIKKFLLELESNQIQKKLF